MTRRFAVVLVILVLALPGILAHGEEEHEITRPGLQASQPPRHVIASTGPAAASFFTAPETDPLRDTIHYTFNGRTGEIRAEHREERSRASTAFNVSVVLERLIEYRDGNGNHRYDPNIDRDVRPYHVRDMSWNVTGPRTVTVSGVNVEYVSATGFFGRGGELRLEFFAASGEADVGRTHVMPQDLKVTLGVAHFPFREPDTRFALVARVVTPVGATVEDTPHDEAGLTAVHVDAARRAAFLSWAANATGNSTFDAPREHPVIAGMRDAVEKGATTESRTLVLSYPRVDYLITHEPVLGVEHAPPAPPPFLGFPVWRILGFLVLVGATWSGWRWTRRNKDLVAERLRALLKRK